MINFKFSLMWDPWTTKICQLVILRVRLGPAISAAKHTFLNKIEEIVPLGNGFDKTDGLRTWKK
jgi:hypothetical protein